MTFCEPPAATALLGCAGSFVGGMLGDLFFRRTRRGRILVALMGVLGGAILLYLTMTTPVESQTQFMSLLLATAIFIPLAAPNVLSTLYDVTLPEVRSTALSIQYFIESAGAALAPLAAGFIAFQSTLGNAILILSVAAWLLGALFLSLTAYFVPKDIATLRDEMSKRAEQELEMQDAAPTPSPA